MMLASTSLGNFRSFSFVKCFRSATAFLLTFLLFGSPFISKTITTVSACQYQHVLTADEWEHVEYYSTFLEKTQLPLEHRKFCFELYSRLAQDQFCILSAPEQQFDDRGKPWYWKMMSVILVNSMYLLEKAMGVGETIVAYRLLRDLSSNEPAVMDWLKGFPLLFELHPQFARSCENGAEGKKIYVYDSPGFEKYTSPRLACAAGQEGQEAFLHRWLLKSNCRVLDPREADFFYVPFYHNGYQREAFDPPPLDATELLDAGYEDLFRNLLAPGDGSSDNPPGYYDAWRRRDHIFLFAHEFWGARKLWVKEHVSKAILLVVEANPLDMKLNPDDDNFIEGMNLTLSSSSSSASLSVDTKSATESPKVFDPNTPAPEEYAEHCLDCFDSRKDSLVPQHIDYVATKKFRENNRGYRERDWLYCFHGAMKHDLYERPNTLPPFDRIKAGGIRAQMLGYIGLPRASVGGHLTPVSAYYERMGNCRFCLVPKGVGYTNGRLFETFFSGCIPVILSDALRFPFSSEYGGPLIWENNLVIRYPTLHMQFLPDFLEKLDQHAVLVERMSVGGGDPPTVEEINAALQPSEGWSREVQDIFRKTTVNGGVVKMKERLERASCWFDYYSEDIDCSPYEGVVRSLRRNRAKMDGY